jgi:DNA-binding NarL/FixJ family response regulator
MLAALGRRDEAAGLLHEAIDILAEAGATRDLRRAEAVLRELGVRRGTRGRRDRPTSGWPSLTPAELQVATLAAQGLSNPEIGGRLFVSRRTVGTHVSHILAKLGIANRTELAAVVSKHATDDESVT